MPCCHCIVCTALRVPRAAGGFAGRFGRRARTTGGKRGRHGKDRRRETTADPLIETVPVRHRVLLRHGRDGRGARRVAPADRHRVDELPGHRRVSCMPIFVTIPAVGTFVTFPIFSGLLLALALVYFLAARARTETCGDTPGLGVW